ncbi:hypothetical protein SEMRO_1534_G280460.1 [Seminavis robusta]|uniref:Uncharacterized protein n=1 Tax=Seminavis robusta TaxID=568900 RepID=A0A9N8ESR3_9STRA|nr:hypothetical protein SEMRO_1534_G280460.1 [Seminavis robusta]|eukprot:Sro1534_g280460.1 n/a (201) ;mRNA; r:12047-12649
MFAKPKQIQETQAEKDSTESSNNSVSPSQLNADNLDYGRGNLQIHDRDCGVARHPAFYKALRALATTSTLKDMHEVIYEGCSSNAAVAPEENLLKLNGDEAWMHLLESLVSLKVFSASNRSGTIFSREADFSEGISQYLNKFCQRQNLPFVFSHQYACGFKEGSADDCVDSHCCVLFLQRGTTRGCACWHDRSEQSEFAR